jgi:glycerophosphoryl diester phosphodiesterase
MFFYINYINKLSDTNTYKLLFYTLSIVFFILSYISQLLNEKRCNKFLGELLRMIHHFLLYFICFGFLAPINILWLMAIINYVTILSWIIYKNHCILTILENNICKLKKNHIFHDLLHNSSVSVDRFFTKIRIPIYALICIFIFLRMYVYYNNKIEIHGHRGGLGNYPENTLAAFRYAIQNDIDTLELDLQMTLDKEIIIYHDKNINTNICDGISVPIKSLTLSEIKNYDCGSKPNINFPEQKSIPGEKIPRFKELIEMILNEYYYKSIKMNVEIKTEQNLDTDEEVYIITKKVIDIIHLYSIRNITTIQSFDIRALKYVKLIDSNIKTSLLIEKQPITDDLIKIAKELNVQIISPEFNLINKNIVDKLKKNGFEVLPWVIDDYETLIKSINYGVNGIITDYPKKMKEYLLQHTILFP